MIDLYAKDIAGLPEHERDLFRKCLDEYNRHIAKNIEKEAYYEGRVRLCDVNIGIALPKMFRNLEIGCAWGAKAVDVLAARSMFDGYVGAGGTENDVLARLVEDNQLITEYGKACRDELKFGCSFAALSHAPDIGCRIRFYSTKSAAALWDGEKGRISCGFVIVAYDETLADRKSVV